MRKYVIIKNMDMISAAMALGLVIALVILGVVVFYSIKGKNKKQIKYQRQSRKVFVKHGINVKKQVLGEEKGEYFTGNLEEQGTCFVNEDNTIKIWRAVFDNLMTGERTYMDFSGQMRIGRGRSEDTHRLKMEITGDSKVSRNHCVIYEMNDMLCIQDLGSRNFTYLNGKCLSQATYLKNGDIILIGNTQLKIQYSLMNNK